MWLHALLLSPPEGTAPTVPFHERRFAQRTTAKGAALPAPESRASEESESSTSTPGGGPLEGGGGLELFRQTTVTYQETSVCIV